MKVKVLSVIAVVFGAGMAFLAFSLVGKLNSASKVLSEQTIASSPTAIPTVPVPTFRLDFDSTLTHSTLYPPFDLHATTSSSSVTLQWQFANKKLTVKTGVHSEYALPAGFRIYRDGFWLADISKDISSYVDEGLSSGESHGYFVSPLTFDGKIEGLRSATVSATTIGASSSATSVVFPTKKIGTYLAEGDSITEGAQVAEQYRWVTLVGNYLAGLYPGIKVLNKGVSGATSGGVMDRLPGELAVYKPDLVTIAVGVNDLIGASRDIGNESMSTYRKNLQTIIAQVRQYPQTDLVLLNIFYSPCCTEKRAAWNIVVADLAREEGVPLVDVDEAMANAGGASLVDSGKLHPTGDGHAVIAKAIIEALKKELEVKH